MGTRGPLVASAAAALFLAGCAGASHHAHASGAEAKVKCEGVNACRGLSDCSTATNGCKGENSCSGKGFLMMSEAECEAAKTAAAERAK